MSYEKLIDECLEYTPLATRATVGDRLRRAAIDFCKEADVLVREVTVTALADQKEILLPSIPGFRSLRVSCFVSPELYPNKDYVQMPVARVRLTRAFKEDTQLTIKVAMQPDEAAQDQPEELERYRDALFTGALRHLLAQFGQPYYNPVLAGEYAREWMGHVADAKRLAARGHHRANRQARYRNYI